MLSRNTSRKILARSLTTALAMHLAVVASASTPESYSGASGGLYSTAGNWTPQTVPNGSSFDAIINQNPGVTVNLDITATLNSLTIGVGNTLNLQNNTFLHIVGGTVNNSGLISLAAGGNASELDFDANTGLTGSGTISLGNNVNNHLSGSNSAVLTVGANQLIEGAGQIGLSQISVVNNGTITANLSAGLLLQPNTAGFLNNGLLLADAGSTLTLRGQTFTNNGVIQANDASFVRMDGNATVTGGTFSTVGTGEVIVSSGNNVALNNVTISTGSQVLGENNTFTYMSGKITNNGTFTLAAGGNATQIRIRGNTELAGNGTFLLSGTTGNAVNNIIVSDGTGFETLTIDPNVNVMGGGNIGDNGMTLVNNGIITANAPVGLVLQPINNATGSGFVNNNIMQASNGSTLFLRGNLFQNNNVIQANDGSFVRLDSGVTVVGGTFTSLGSGQIITSSGSNVFLNNVTISSGTNFLAENNTTTAITGTLANNGTVTIEAGGNATNFLIPGAVDFTGTGTYILANTTNAQINGNSTNSALTVHPGITIEGVGSLTGMAINNQGLLLGNSTAGSLTINPTGTGLNNNGGIVKASNGATVSLINGTILNTGGTLTADVASTISITSNANVTGGILSSVGSGQILLGVNGQFATLNNVAVAAGTNVVEPNNGTVNVIGTLTNNGTYTIQAGGNTTNISIGGPVDFVGTGTFVLSNSPNAAINGNSTASALTIHPGITIEGLGSLTGMAINNQGLILGNSTVGALTINPTGAGLNNSGGTVKAANGTTISLINGTVLNTGGTLTADVASTISITSNATVLGGILSSVGSGQILLGVNGQFATLNNVTIAPGANVVEPNDATVNVIGTLTNNGTYTIQAGGNTTNISIGGPVDFVGTGTFILDNTTNAAINGNSTASALTIHPGITIEGLGSLATMAINNQGLILGNNPSGALTISPSGAGLNNSGGTVEAANGATITFNGGTITNTGGTLTAANLSMIRLGGNVVVNGGTLSTTGSGLISVIAGLTVNLNNTTLTAGSAMNAENDSDTFMSGLITNNGVFTLNGGGNATRIVLSGNTEFAGTGTFTFSNSSNNQLTTQNSSPLTIDSGITLQGTGNIGEAVTTIINNGTIIGNQSNGLILQPVSAGTNSGFTNNGLILASNAATVFLRGGIFQNNGVIQANDTSFVRLDTSITVNGGVFTTLGSGEIITTSGNTVNLNNVTLSTGSNYLDENNADTYLSGIITNNGTFTLGGGGNLTRFIIPSNTEFAGTGTFTISNSSNSEVTGQNNSTLTVDSGVTIQGGSNVGEGVIGIVNAGTFIANVSTPLTITTNTTNFSNTGTLIATNGATMNVTSLVQDSTSTLTAGTYKAFANSTINIINGVDIVTNDASVYLSGLGSTFARINPIAINNGDFHILAGRKFTTAGDFTNNGTLELGDSTLDTGGATFDLTTHSLTNNANGLIIGFGFINGRPLNHGTIEAKGGVLAFSNGINGGSGTIQSDAGGTLDLSAGSSNSSGDFLVNNGSLTLGSNNVIVSDGYTNANFGIGDLFNKHANVSPAVATAGAGGILANGDNTEVLGGNVAAAPGSVVLSFNAIHVGDVVTKSYTITNSGSSGPSVLYAIQIASNGGNITDSRLTGTGVTSSNVGPLAINATPANENVTFTGLGDGPLTGQTIHVANNFDNITEQTFAINGTAYNYAAPVVTGNSINFQNHHVGDTVAPVTITVKNNAPSDGFSEKLDSLITSSTGSIAITGGFSLLAAQSNDSSSITATLNTSNAGSQSGFAILSLTSDGLGTSGLPSTSLTSVPVSAAGNVYRYAVGVVNNNPVNFGNHRVGDTVSTTISVQNNVPNDTFSENLDGTLSSPTGTNSFGGSFTGITPGNSTNITASLDTSSAGTKSGTASLALISDGLGSSGLGTTPRSTVTLSSSGTVYRYATAGTIPNINLNTVRVNTTNSTFITISNTAANDGLSDKLNASFAGTTGGASVSGGPITVNPITSNSASMSISLDTSHAGLQSGTATVHFDSNGTGEGLNIVPLPVGANQTVTISANVLNLAAPSMRQDSGDGTLTTAPQSATLDFGSISASTSVHASLSVLNIAVGPADDLAGSWSISGSGPFTLTNFGDIGDITAGGALSNLMVDFSNLTPGLYTETITLDPISHDSALPDLPLTNYSFTLSANVTPAVPEPASLALLGCAATLMLRRRRRTSGNGRA